MSFGDAIQVFNIGAASVGTYGTPVGICEASSRFGRAPLAELVAPAARLAREGVEVTPAQAYVFEILADIVTSTPECAALFAPGGRLLRAGDTIRQPELADTLERLGSDGPRALLHGATSVTAIVEWVVGAGGRSRRPTSTGTA